MKLKLAAFTSILLNLLFVANAQSDIQRLTAYFYVFEPNTCLMSFDNYNSTNDCSVGVISVALDDASSVNVSLISKLGSWQLMLSEGNTSQPQIEVIAIRSIEDTANIDAKPKFLFTRNNGDIIRGTCSSIKIMQRTSGNCEIILRDSRKIQMKFETNNLRLADNVE